MTGMGSLDKLVREIRIVCDSGEDMCIGVIFEMVATRHVWVCLSWHMSCYCDHISFEFACLRAIHQDKHTNHTHAHTLTTHLHGHRPGVVCFKTTEVVKWFKHGTLVVSSVVVSLWHECHHLGSSIDQTLRSMPSSCVCDCLFYLLSIVTLSSINFNLDVLVTQSLYFIFLSLYSWIVSQIEKKEIEREVN